jgi:hypothetical protein|tara:strand:+ start:7635 stop:7820 length:186 start_codon:yes stop_codon:yes gene_type:complete
LAGKRRGFRNHEFRNYGGPLVVIGAKVRYHRPKESSAWRVIDGQKALGASTLSSRTLATGD